MERKVGERYLICKLTVKLCYQGHGELVLRTDMKISETEERPERDPHIMDKVISVEKVEKEGDSRWSPQHRRRHSQEHASPGKAAEIA